MTPDDTFKKLKTLPFKQAFAEQVNEHLARGFSLKDPFLIYFIRQEANGRLEVIRTVYQDSDFINKEYEYQRMSGTMPVYKLKD